MKKVLLLNGSLEPLCFCDENKAWKLIFLDKVDIVHHWNDYSVLVNNRKISNPSVIKLKEYVYIPAHRMIYNRDAIIRRDNSQCQYCTIPLHPKDITIDHVQPKSKGGKNSFYNCVVACSPCNLQKADRTLQESGFKLKSIPDYPNKVYITRPKEDWNQFWEQYL